MYIIFQYRANLLLNWDFALTMISILLWACRSITDSIQIRGWGGSILQESFLILFYLDVGVEPVGHQFKLPIGGNEGYCPVILKPGLFKFNLNISYLHGLLCLITSNVVFFKWNERVAVIKQNYLALSMIDLSSRLKYSLKCFQLLP